MPLGFDIDFHVITNVRFLVQSYAELVEQLNEKSFELEVIQALLKVVSHRCFVEHFLLEDGV